MTLRTRTERLPAFARFGLVPIGKSGARARLQRIYDPASGVMPAPIGDTGYRLPELGDPWVAQPRPGLGPDWARSNWVVMSGRKDRLEVASRIRVSRGCTGNMVICGPRSSIPRSIHFQGDNGVIVLGSHCPWVSDLDIRLSSDDEVLFWGNGATSNGTSIVLSGEGTSVIVGEDCMFATDTVVRTSDLHAIISTASGEWLNAPESVHLEPHVWVGQEAMILKGVRIGAGSIIGAKALVNADVEPFVIAGGIPAKVIKRDATWDRRTVPDPDALSRAKALSVQGIEPKG